MKRLIISLCLLLSCVASLAQSASSISNDSSWEKMQSEIAVGTGGVWGKGYTKGTTNIVGFLPRSTDPSDFIVSVQITPLGWCVFAVLLTAVIGTVIWILRKRNQRR